MNEVQQKLFPLFVRPVQSAVEMRDWIVTFLDVDLPLGHIDPDSNSSPVEAMYEAYAAYRDDLCETIPGYIWLASRDSGKTLSGAILNVMLLIHFKAQVAHLAAVRKQAEKCLEYVNLMVRKITPYLDAMGRKVLSESKNKVTIENEDQTVSFIDIVVANLAGGNAQHCPVASYDEIDTLSKQGLIGYKEAKLIPTRFKGKGPLVLKFSTRKFAFGIFEQEVQNADKTGEQVRRWNLLDVTEKCFDDRCLPAQPKTVRYLPDDLPLQNLSPEEYEHLPVDVQQHFRPMECMAGCAKCPLLSVCFLPGTPVRMYDGTLKAIESIVVGDRVLTHTGKTSLVVRTMHREYTGDIYHVSAWGHPIPIGATPEHPWFTPRGLVTSQELSIGALNRNLYTNSDYLLTPRRICGSKQFENYWDVVPGKVVIQDGMVVGLSRSRKDKSKYHESKIPVQIPLTYDWGKLCGLFLSEGSFSKGTRRRTTIIRNPINVNFSFHEKEVELIEFIRHFAAHELFGAGTYFHHSNSKGVQISINSRILAELLFRWFGEYCYQKKIPDRLLCANKAFLTGLFDGMYLGDGAHTFTNGQKALTLANPALVQQMQFIGWSLGIHSSLHPIRSTPEKRPCQAISWIEGQPNYHKRIKQETEQYFLNRLKVQPVVVPYKGIVYNLEVEGDNSYVVGSLAVHNCQGRLHDRPDDAIGGVYRSIPFTILQFKKTDADLAAAQLMCWRPSKQGLVYGRFSDINGAAGNILTIDQAWRVLTDEVSPKGLTIEYLIDEMLRKGLKFVAGVDWGFRHAFAIGVSIKMPNGEWWLMDTYARPGLEFEQMIELSEQVRDRYRITRWYCDTSQPMFIKAFRKRAMPCPQFKKDVQGGVESVRAQIVDGIGKRLLKVIKHDRNSFLIDMFHKHSFELDAAGDPTIEPSDDQWADVADQLRYVAQNLFPVDKKKGRSKAVKYPDYSPQALAAMQQEKGQDFNSLKIKELTKQPPELQGRSASGTISWDFTGKVDPEPPKGT